MIILYESVIRAVVINQHLVPSRNYGKLAGNHPPSVFCSGNTRDKGLGSDIVLLVEENDMHHLRLNHRCLDLGVVNVARHIMDIVNVDLDIDLRQIFRILQRPPVTACGHGHAQHQPDGAESVASGSMYVTEH